MNANLPEKNSVFSSSRKIFQRLAAGAVLFLLSVAALAASAQSLPDVELRWRGAELYTGAVVYGAPTRQNDPMPALEFSLRNAGSADLTVVSVEADAPFQLQNAPAGPLAPLAAANFSLAFSAAETGVHEARLVVRTDDPDEGEIIVTLRCLVLPAWLDDVPLLINEFASGPEGEGEFIEFVVPGAPGTCRDISGFIFDDNSGRGNTCGAGGVTRGHYRFTNHAQWQNIKAGAMIVAYNDSVPPANLPENDYYDHDEDNVYVIPISNMAFFEGFSPNEESCNEFRTENFSVWWMELEFSDAHGDLYQAAPNATDDPVFAAAAGLNGAGADVELPRAFGGQVWYLAGGPSESPFDAANWQNGALVEATPGRPNSPENAAWLAEMKTQIFGATAPLCAELGLTFTTNAVSATSFDWSFNLDETPEVSGTAPAANYFSEIPKRVPGRVFASGGGCATVSADTTLLLDDCRVAVVVQTPYIVCLDDQNGATLTLDYEVKHGTLPPGAVLVAELNRFFDAPSSSREIGWARATGQTGQIEVTLPPGLATNRHYSIRVNVGRPRSPGIWSDYFTVVNTDQTACNPKIFPDAPNGVYLVNPLSPPIVVEDALMFASKVEWFAHPTDSAATTGLLPVAVEGGCLSNALYAPYIMKALQPGEYWIKALVRRPCVEDPVFTNAFRIVVSENAAYQGGEPGDCWQYEGFAPDRTTAGVVEAPPFPGYHQNVLIGARSGENVIYLGENGVSWVEFAPWNVADYANMTFGISLATAEGDGPGLDSGENVLLQYSTDCGATWAPMDALAGGDDTQFAWDQTSVGFTNNPPFNDGCCADGSYAGGPEFCGRCGASGCASCLEARPMANPFSFPVPPGAENFSVRVGLVDNDMNPILTDRADEVVYIDDVYLRGNYQSEKPRLVMEKETNGCDNEILYRATIEHNIKKPRGCETRYYFQWYVNGQLVAVTGSEEETTEVTFLDGALSGISEISVFGFITTGMNFFGQQEPGCALAFTDGYHECIIPIRLRPDITVDASEKQICLGESSTIIFDLICERPPYDLIYTATGPEGTRTVELLDYYLDPHYEILTPDLPGSYTYEVQLVAWKDCEFEADNPSVTVTVDAPPQMPQPADNLVCAIGKTSIPIGGGQAFTGTWTFMDRPETQSFLANGPTAYGNIIDGIPQSLGRGTYILRWDGQNGACEETVYEAHSVLRQKCDPTEPLPVELLTFEAAYAPDLRAVRLDWLVASETQNSHFEILRSADGRDFAPVGVAQGAGNSTVKRDYAFIDKKLPAGAGRLYYRLRQVDFDGGSALTEIREARLPQAAPQRVRVFPNPAAEAFTLEIAGAGAEPVEVELLNLSGQVVVRQTLALADGFASARFDLSGIPAGVYSLRLRLNGEIVARRVVRQ